MKKLTLKEAITKGKLDQFIKEHAGQLYDASKFEATLNRVLGRSKATPAASSQGSCENCNGTQTRPRKKKGA